MNIAKAYSVLVLLALSVTVSYFLDADAKNWLLLAIMGLSPMYVIKYTNFGDRVVFNLLLFIVLIFIVSIINPGFKFSSLLYTSCFITSFIFIRSSLSLGFFSYNYIKKLLRYLIYAYFIVLLLQQFCVLIGIPPINNFYDLSETNKWKLASLAPEASHLAIFMFFIMYAFIEISEIGLGRHYRFSDGKKDYKLWIAYLWVMLTCNSTSAILFVGILFFRHISFKVFAKFLVFGVVFLIIGLSIFHDNQAFNRAINFIDALLTLDFSIINAVDHSAAYRIVPFYAYIEHAHLSNLGFWFGEGMGAGKQICQEYMAYYSGDGSYITTDVPVGGTMASFINFGIIPFIPFVVAIYKMFKVISNKLLKTIWTIFALIIGINMQMFWFTLILMLFISYYSDINNEYNRKRIV